MNIRDCMHNLLGVKAEATDTKTAKTINRKENFKILEPIFPLQNNIKICVILYCIKNVYVVLHENNSYRIRLTLSDL